MRILMLGWEFPPNIAGGLGVACHGLTRALDSLGHEVVFLMPGAGEGDYLEVIASGSVRQREPEERSAPKPLFQSSSIQEIPSPVQSPYAPFDLPLPEQERARRELLGAGVSPPPHPESPPPGREPRFRPPPAPYAGDLVQAANDFARSVVALARYEPFDIVHAHDWLTFTAGIAIARVADRPLVVHIHSTEFDRSGDEINQTIYDLERRGLFAADRVIAVSALTKSICVRHYGVNPGKVDVVYNGVEARDPRPLPRPGIAAADRIVLFVGRITAQKGPEYFLAAAQRVLEKASNVKFVIAGSGDLGQHMMCLAAELGISDKVFFTGFLRGQDLERIFQIADCYVMPSISEPFGIAALEAAQHGIPVIVSKQSGVSEVLTHALKVDFWKTEELADKILAVLLRPALASTLREHGAIEVRWLTWDGAAAQCLATYSAALRDRGA